MHRVWVLVGIALSGCGRIGFDSIDDGPRDAIGLGHVTLMPGWTVDVYRDFSPDHSYNPNDFNEPPNVYSNAPTWLLTLRAPFPEVLGVIAGRDVIEVSSTTYVPHEFGNHSPNNANEPDNLKMAVVSDNFRDLGPRILAASASLDTGDGMYGFDLAWSSTRYNPLNNTHSLLDDPAGVLTGTAGVYLGAEGGVWLDPMFMNGDQFLLVGEPWSMHLVSSTLLLARYATNTDARLMRINTIAPLTQTELLQRTSILLTDGDPQTPGRAWAIFDREQLVQVDTAGSATTIASITGSDFAWDGATAPPAGHPLAGIRETLYVLETNRALDIDRILILTGP